jgi:hypothetical protein
LADIFVNGNRADAVGYDIPAGGVFDVLNMSKDMSIDGGIFENAVASLVEGTVFQ